MSTTGSTTSSPPLVVAVTASSVVSAPATVSPSRSPGTPHSLDALARVAQALDVSLDHLVFDDIARRPLHASHDVLGDRLNAIAELAPDDLAALNNLIDGLIAKTRLRALTNQIS